MLVRRAQLCPDNHGLEAAEHEKGERGIEIKYADALVIYGAEPAPEAGMLTRVFGAVRRG
jgi:hypothetical protein